MVNPTIEQIQAHIEELKNKIPVTDEDCINIPVEINDWLTVLEHKIFEQKKIGVLVDTIDTPLKAHQITEKYGSDIITKLLETKFIWLLGDSDDGYFCGSKKVTEYLQTIDEKVLMELCYNNDSKDLGAMKLSLDLLTYGGFKSTDEEINNFLSTKPLTAFQQWEQRVNNREKAMDWWNQLNSNQKTQFCDITTEQLSTRSWLSLTDEEIENLYQEYWEEYLHSSEIAFPKSEEVVLNEKILPDTFDIIHAVPFGSDKYKLAGIVHAFSLEEAYRMTQNDSDNSVNLKTRSTSVGDIIGHDGKYYLVKGIGFEEVESPFLVMKFNHF